jgi:hypothetical protein
MGRLMAISTPSPYRRDQVLVLATNVSFDVNRVAPISYTHVSRAPCALLMSAQRPVARTPFQVITAPARTAPDGVVLITTVAAPVKTSPPESCEARVSVMSSTWIPIGSCPTSKDRGPVESHTPVHDAASANTNIGAERCRRRVRRSGVDRRCAGDSPPSGIGSAWADRSNGTVVSGELAIARSTTSIGDLGNRAIDDVSRIDRDLHDEPQTPAASWDDAPSSSLPRAAIIEIQRCDDRLRRLQQLPFDAQVAEGSEVWAHCVSGIEERPELALKLHNQIVVGRILGDVVTSDQQSQREGELLDRVADTVETLLAQSVLAESISRRFAAHHRRDPPAHLGTGCGASAIASASSRYAARSDADTASTGTPCMPA